MSNPSFLGRQLRLVGYGRKSDQDDGVSITDQIAWMERLAQEEGFELVRVFRDQAKAGWDTKARTEFHAMLEFCQQAAKRSQPLDGVLCWAPDRFSRADSQETSHYLWAFRQVGVDRMRTHTRGWLDFSRMTDRAIFGMEQEFGAHAYVQNLAQRTLGGRLRVARQGKWLATAPLGYVLIDRPDARRRLALADEETVERVRWMFRRLLEPDGNPFGIARELTRRGIPTPTGKVGWSHQTVRQILSNPVYAGRTWWNRESHGRFARVVGFTIKERQGQGPVENAPEEWVEYRDIPALIDLETFDRVQAKLAQLKRGRRRQPLVYPLSGLLVCGHCGRRMVGLQRPSKKADHPPLKRYVCKRIPSSACATNSIDADRLLFTVAGRLEETVFQERALAEELERRLQVVAARRAKQPGEAGRWRRRSEELVRKLDRAETRFLDEEDQALWPKHRQRIQELREQLADAQRQQAAANLVAGQSEADLRQIIAEAAANGRHLRRALAEGDTAEVRRIIELAVERIELFFTHTPAGKRQTSRFIKGLIHLREAFPVVQHCLVFSGGEHLNGTTACRGSICALALLPEHLVAVQGTPPLENPSQG